MKRPFLKKFKTGQYYYLYDVNSNGIMRVDKVVYDLVDELGINSADGVVAMFKKFYTEIDIRQRWDTLKRLQQENHYFSCHRPQIFSGIHNEEDVKETYTADLSQIIFELTENCSQRCKYCTFSGNYSFNRTHGIKNMPEEIALKAAKFFLNNTFQKEGSTNIPAITFYGGEPLLNFDLLKKIIEYSKTNKNSRKYRYSFTTNCTLLDDQMLYYLVENSVSMLISLDGPKDVHDHNRVFQNGAGTFDSVYANLKKIFLSVYMPEI